VSGGDTQGSYQELWGERNGRWGGEGDGVETPEKTKVKTPKSGPGLAVWGGVQEEGTERYNGTPLTKESIKRGEGTRKVYKGEWLNWKWIIKLTEVTT